MKWLLVIGSFLTETIKSSAVFFLSGGGCIFLAVASFSGLIYTFWNTLSTHAATLVGWIDDLRGVVENLQGLQSSDLGDILIYACAVDSLLSYAASFLGVIFTIIGLVCFGLLSAAFAVLLPILFFKVVHYIRKQIVGVSSRG